MDTIRFMLDLPLNAKQAERLKIFRRIDILFERHEEHWHGASLRSVQKKSRRHYKAYKLNELRDL